MWIEVVNWDEWNPRGNEKKKYHMHWFRVESTIFSDPQFGRFSPADWAAFFYILAITCQRQGKPWELDVNFCAEQCRVKINELEATVDKLSKLNIVRLSEHCRPIKSSSSAIQDRTGQDNILQANIQKIWNEHRHRKQPECTSLTTTRKKLWDKCVEEKPKSGYWEKLIQALSKSPYHRGEGPDGWVATIDWLLKPGKHVEIHEQLVLGKKTQNDDLDVEMP